MIPVLFDTDIGSDIDDTWALALLLNCPELDVKLITVSRGETIYRTKLVAKFLERCGRTDIPIGTSDHEPDVKHKVLPNSQELWVRDYELDTYVGVIYHDGIQAMVDTIMSSAVPVTILCTGPATNVAKALELEPRIADNARFIGMHGSVYKGVGGSDQVINETNVRIDPGALQQVFRAPWEVQITPLDTCGIVQVRGHKNQAILQCGKPEIVALYENYQYWEERMNAIGRGQNLKGYRIESKVLFDTVPIGMALSDQWLEYEEIGLRIDADGYMHMDDTQRKVICALKWKDLDGFEDFLVQRLTS